MKLLEGLRQLAGWGPAGTDSRWVVVDVETSGLDPDHDRLLAIGAVAIQLVDRRPHIVIGDSFETLLQQQEHPPDRPNILVHGIGVGAQRGALAPAAALAAFEHWLGAAPLIAFHAAFDQRVIQRAMMSVLGRRHHNPWVDLAPVAGALLPQVKAHTLDQWLANAHIRCLARHRAAADALATAELVLSLWPALLAQTKGSQAGFRSLQRIAAQGRWLHR
jgi:DNA polymerase-3 subunit epsilon